MTPRVGRLTILQLVMFLASPAHPAEAQRAWTAVVRRFDAFADAAHVVGGSAVLVHEGRIVARHHYGFADRAGSRRVDDSTIYHWPLSPRH